MSDDEEQIDVIGRYETEDDDIDQSPMHGYQEDA